MIYDDTEILHLNPYIIRNMLMTSWWAKLADRCGNTGRCLNRISLDNEQKSKPINRSSVLLWKCFFFSTYMPFYAMRHYHNESMQNCVASSYTGRIDRIFRMLLLIRSHFAVALRFQTMRTRYDISTGMVLRMRDALIYACKHTHTSLRRLYMPVVFFSSFLFSDTNKSHAFILYM